MTASTTSSRVLMMAGADRVDLDADDVVLGKQH